MSALHLPVAVMLCAIAAWPAYALEQYEIGTMTDQTAYFGYTRSFQVQAPSGTGWVYSLQAAPAPAGAIHIDDETGVFEYTPAPEDRSPFELIFNASSGSNTVSQTIVMITVCAIVPESDIIFYSRPLVDPAEQAPIIVVDNRPDVTRWNHRSFPSAGQYAKEVTVSGLTVVFDREIGSLYTQFDERDDLVKMTISAQTVIIRETLQWMGTEVVINAKTLRFENVAGRDPACIVTTPAPWLPGTEPLPANAVVEVNDDHSAETLRTPAGNGAKGLPAGNVTLNVQEFESLTETGEEAAPDIKRFALAGAQGQQPGLGCPGPQGESKPTFQTASGYLPGVHWPAIDVGPGVTALYELEREMAFCVPGIYPIHHWQPDQAGWDDWHPGNGFDAEPPGMPGDGGDGGSLYTTNLDWADYCDMSGGAAGNPGADVGGGTPGNPVPARRVSGWWLDDITPLYEQDCVWAEYGTDSHLLDAGTDVTICLWPIEMGSFMLVPGVNESYSAVGGADGTGPVAGNETTLPGQANLIELSESWIAGGVLRGALNEIRTMYLNGHVEEARQIIEYYLGLIEGAQGDDLRQIQEELLVLHYRASNNLDYFGNPAGWVPMLSFEANLAAFENEIERGIHVLYLTYWLTQVADETTDKVEAFKAARLVLRQELDEYITQYEDAASRIPELQITSENIEASVQTHLAALQNLENVLLAQAQQHTRPPIWKGPVKVAGLILKMVPVYQPVVGAIGEGMGLVAEFDPKKPWDSITGMIGLAATTTNQALADKSTELGKKIAELKKTAGQPTTPNPAMDDAQALQGNIDKMRDAAQLVAKGIGPLAGALKGTQVPESAVKAELEKLRASNPAFEAITKSMKALMDEKALFAEQLASAVQDLTTASTGITQTLMALQATADYINTNAGRVDERARMYLNEMAQRAQDRLLKYQYYMAKAFEYRLLRPYVGDLNLNNMFNRFLTMAAPPDGLLDPEKFLNLKELYMEELLRITAEMFDDLNTNAPERSAPVTFALSRTELDELNDLGYVYINLKERNIFGLTEENLRIVDLKTDEIVVGPEAGGSYGGTAILRLRFEHSGHSRLASRGNIYRFTHYRTNDVNPISWKTIYDGITNTWQETTISAASNSLLRFLLEDRLGHVNPDMLLYSRPAAWADILITKEQVSSTGVDMLVDTLRVQVQYDYFEKRNDRSELEIVSSNKLMPQILLNGPAGVAIDTNGRGDGIGSFTRVYNRGETISVDAPSMYGTWAFEGWLDVSGTTAKSMTDLGSVTLPMSGHQRIEAVYVNLEDSVPPPAPIITTNGGETFTIGLSAITLNGTTASDTQCIRVNGQDIEYEPGSTDWETAITLEIGAQTYTVVALDAALNESPSVSITINHIPLFDSDQDGIEDALEGSADVDGDSIPNYLDSDSDDDGMPDEWERTNSLDPYFGNGQDDQDGDGASNLYEFLYQSDPNDPASAPSEADLEVEPLALTLSGMEPSATIAVNNLGQLPLQWTAECDNPSLVLSATEGNGPGTLTVHTFDFADTREAVLTLCNLNDPEDTAVVRISIVAGPSPANLDVSTNLLILTPATPFASFNVVNLGELPLEWSADTASTAVSLDPPSGVGPMEVMVAAGTFAQHDTAAITLRNLSNPADREVVVVQLQEDLVPGDLAVSSNLLLLTEAAPSASFNIINLGGVPIGWTVTADLPELIFEPQAGEGAATITVAFTDFREDRATNIVVVNTDDPEDSESVAVRIRHTPTSAAMDLSVNSLILTEEAPAATFEVINRGDLELQWEIACDSAMIAIDPMWGTDTATVTVTADDFTQDAAAAIMVTNSANPADVEVVAVQIKRNPYVPFSCREMEATNAAAFPQAAGTDALLWICTLLALFRCSTAKKRLRRRGVGNPTFFVCLRRSRAAHGSSSSSEAL